MAIALIKSSWTFSLLGQLAFGTLKGDQVTKYVFQAATCIQCRDYHATHVHFVENTKRKPKQTKHKEKEKSKPHAQVWSNMLVSDLSASTNRKPQEVLDALHIASAKKYTNTSFISDITVIQRAVKVLGQKCAPEHKKKEPVPDKINDIVRRPAAKHNELVKRHPIVTIMGHIDHGKTTLLDALRHTSVVDTEFGGITQHIGAFNVSLKTGDRVTFLDTPGHAAFSAMRSRGAQVTDIVVLVVAADDGVMDQTVQSIKMAQNFNVPIIVAINKIDKPQADIKRTQQMLLEYDITVEDLGGNVQSVNISALKGTNLEGLIEAITLQAELMNLKGDPKGLVEGVIIESSVDINRGSLATVLVQRGKLKKGAFLVSGLTWAKVKAMYDHKGNQVSEARLSEAVQILGWKSIPVVGDEMIEAESEKRVNAVVKLRQDKAKQQKLMAYADATAGETSDHIVYQENILKRGASKEIVTKTYTRSVQIIQSPQEYVPKLCIIVKADVTGSAEAISQILDTYPDNDACRLSVAQCAVGSVTEGDIDLAETFNGIIYAFNVHVPKDILAAAETRGVTIRSHNIIYKFVEDIKEEINSLLPPIDVENAIGEATVLQEFEIRDKKKKVKVAGCRCIKGTLQKDALFRVERKGEVIHRGKLASMRILKNEVDCVTINTECGLRLEDFPETFEPDDCIVCFTMIKQENKTNWSPGF